MTNAAKQIPTGEWLISSPSETLRLGEKIGEQLTGGEILLLDGPLGAGKTVLVKGIAAGLGIDREDVTSPSFTLVNPHAGRLPLFHIDLYRLDEGVTSANAVDLEELLSDEKAVIVIEWGERLGRYPLPLNVWRVVIDGDGDEPRRISIRNSV